MDTRIKKIIGLDFGDCDIAAATYIKNEDGSFRIDDLYLDDQKNKVIKNEVTYKDELFNYYKESPEHFDEEINGDTIKVRRRELLEVKFKSVIKAIIDCNTGDLKKESILLIVGCPSSSKWTSSKYINEYTKLIKKATGISEVRVEPESRAAMFSALADGKGRRISARTGAIVYDFGSSTADCTYMRTGENPIEYSWRLGASEIEKKLREMFCEEAVRQSYNSGNILEPFNNSSKIERKLRDYKEAYFNGTLDDDSPFSYKFKTTNGKKNQYLLMWMKILWELLLKGIFRCK